MEKFSYYIFNKNQGLAKDATLLLLSFKHAACSFVH